MVRVLFIENGKLGTAQDAGVIAVDKSQEELLCLFRIFVLLDSFDTLAEVGIFLRSGDQTLDSLRSQGILIDMGIDGSLRAEQVYSLFPVRFDPVHTGADDMNHLLLRFRNVFIDPGQEEVGGIAGQDNAGRACFGQVAHGVTHLLHELILLDMAQEGQHPAGHGTAVVNDDPGAVPFLLRREDIRVLFKKMNGRIGAHAAEDTDHKIVFLHGTFTPLFLPPAVSRGYIRHRICPRSGSFRRRLRYVSTGHF